MLTWAVMPRELNSLLWGLSFTIVAHSPVPTYYYKEKGQESQK